MLQNFNPSAQIPMLQQGETTTDNTYQPLVQTGVQPPTLSASPSKSAAISQTKTFPDLHIKFQFCIQSKISPNLPEKSN